MTLSEQPSGPPYRAKVTAIENGGPDIKIIYLKPEPAFAYKAGQYINISFDNLTARPYSIACAPGQDTLEVHIKRGKGPASHYALEKLQIGEDIAFQGPGGASHYDDKTDPDPVLALAGGLGIAPIKAIIEQALKAESAPSFSLYWGTYTEEERYLDDYFHALAKRHNALHYKPVSGDLVGDIAAQDIEDFSGFKIFISGPPAMISHTVPLLRDKGAKAEKISYDAHPEAAKVTS